VIYISNNFSGITISQAQSWERRKKCKTKVLMDKPLEKWLFRRQKSWKIHTNMSMKELSFQVELNWLRIITITFVSGVEASGSTAAESVTRFCTVLM